MHCWRSLVDVMGHAFEREHQMIVTDMWNESFNLLGNGGSQDTEDITTVGANGTMGLFVVSDTQPRHIR